VSDITYIPQEVRLTWLVNTVEYAVGDYAYLHGNGGAGAVNYTAPLSRGRIDLYPGRQVMGWCRMPWCAVPWCGGGSYLNVVYAAATPGNWRLALAAWDQAGNAHVGTPAEAALFVSLTPAPPPALNLVSYDPDSDELVLAERI